MSARSNTGDGATTPRRERLVQLYNLYRMFDYNNAKSTKSVASVGYTVATVKYPLAWVSATKR